MDNPSDIPTYLAFDQDQALEVLPILILIATELDAIPHRYSELNRLFRQHFLSIFTGHNSHVQVHEQLWAALNSLHDLTKNANLIEEPLYWLELNNDRIALACNMLSMLLEPPSDPAEADNN